MFLPRLTWVVVHALFAKRADLVAENLALRQQLIVFRRKVGRPRLRRRDRIFWLWLSRSWDGWRDTLIVVKPATVIRWHRQGFKYDWASRRFPKSADSTTDTPERRHNQSRKLSCRGDGELCPRTGRIAGRAGSNISIADFRL
jgi:hypothetical protein